MTATGGCLCGAVRYSVDGPLRDAMGCHCTLCRRQSGHFIAATSVPRANLTVEGEAALTWFASSPGHRRGFCATCGSHLFWDSGTDRMGIFAGSLDPGSGVRLAAHIFGSDKGDYYEISDGLPVHDGYPLTDT